jgi:hypothetical protein
MAGRISDLAASRLKGLEAAAAMLPLTIHAQVPRTVLRPDHVELFAIVRGFAKGPARLAALRKAFPNIVEQVAAALREHGLDASVLGRASAGAVADRLLNFLANFGITAEDQLKFNRSVRGYRSNVAGEVMEWLVEANNHLLGDILSWARSATNDLISAADALRGLSAKQVAQVSERLVDARNATVEVPTAGGFGGPLVASDIFLRMNDGTKRKFVDAMTVSLYRIKNDPPLLVGPTTLGQYKFNTAIRKAAGQTEGDQARLVDAAELVFRAGGIEYFFKPEQIVFIAGAKRPEMNQYVVTHSDALISQVGRKPLYASSPELLLGGSEAVGPPQITPFVGRNGKVHAVLVELAMDSRFVMALVDAVIGKP